MLNRVNFYKDNFQKSSKISIGSELMEKVYGMVQGKSFEQVCQMVNSSPSKAQFVALASLYCIAVEKSQNPRDFDPADGIIWRLGESVAKFGEKAYPLSEKQVGLVVSKVRAWL